MNFAVLKDKRYSATIQAVISLINKRDILI